ncbi:MAG TPA: MFS transporter [Gammaproteobacteria bacterium]|nr:MFS transporter [Gammaproteobacteria bacterium]
MSDATTNPANASYRQLFANPRVAAVTFLAFASGLPLALTSGTLQAWLATAGVDIRTIGVFSLVGLPYTLKFLWAPVMDRFVPPWLGRRRGWMLLTQLALAGGIFAMSLLDPPRHILLLGALAFLVAFLSASQDVVFDAYRTDVLPARERGIGAAVSVFGYRIAMLTSGALALVLSDHIGWSDTYLLMAALMGTSLFATLAAPDPSSPAAPPPSFRAAVVEPFREFIERPGALALVALIVLYKLGDAFAGTLTTAFLIQALGFTATDVGAINKGMGLVATLAGALYGGMLLARIGLYRALLAFGLLQAVTNLAFMALALIGRDYAAMIAAVALENLAGGMGTAAFVALLMALCDRRYTATQYALLSALASLGRVFVGPPAGVTAVAVGWPAFFALTALIALPGLVVLARLRHPVEAVDRDARGR